MTAPPTAPPAAPAPGPAQPGTGRDAIHASSSARRTRDRVEPLLDRFGITRVADLTGLDEVGVPVHAAYRPGGTTLSVSLGVALDPVRSWVGAVMESIETWHAENVVAPVRRASADELHPPYDVRSLPLAPGSPLTAATVVDWLPGRGLLTGAAVPVPRGVVELDFTRDATWDGDWDGVLFAPSSNGTAVGATRVEAQLHAVLEVAERDAGAAFAGEPEEVARHVDPDRTGSPTVAALLRGLRGAGCRVGLRELTTAAGLPVYACTVWAADLPVAFTGFGCHLDAATAVERAMAEAVLCRVGTISGARDDLEDELFAATSDAPRPPPEPSALRPLGPSVVVTAPPGDPLAAAAAAVRLCAARIRARTGCEPVAVDLTHPGTGIPAVKVVAPGMRMFGDDLGGRRG